MAVHWVAATVAATSEPPHRLSPSKRKRLTLEEAVALDQDECMDSFLLTSGTGHGQSLLYSVQCTVSSGTFDFRTRLGERSDSNQLKDQTSQFQNMIHLNDSFVFMHAGWKVKRPRANFTRNSIFARTRASTQYVSHSTLSMINYPHKKAIPSAVPR